ncbi:hypothetical protein QP519_10720 [Weeksella virosa]|uniref:hypothetical protein n=1 Tax=Weeksella virosa TaxID=1014 RepID=UPI0025552ECB|nr:hypothetical protein [Weeksella virosa]MDK7376007.1 hypothetical protein [Weeksella virosa]
MARLEDCLEDFETENVGLACEIEDLDAGTSEHAYYALVEHVKEIKLPSGEAAKTFAGSVTIADAIEMHTGKKFSKINLQVDLNELTSNYVGNVGNLKTNSNFEGYIAGVQAQLVGMQKKMRNKRIILLVPDNNGNTWLVGTVAKPARITSFDIATGKTDDDNNGATLNIMSKTNIYKYTAAIPLAEAGG